MRTWRLWVILLIVISVFGFLNSCKELDNTDTTTDKNNTSSHTVTFVANGGSPAPKQQSITQGGKVTKPAVMTRTGFGFGGWYKEAKFTNLWNFDVDTVTQDITLYAMWDTNYYTVNFEANGGSPAPVSQNVAHGKKAVNPSVMTKEGYLLDGWYKEAECKNVWNFSVDIVTSTITLYAKWVTAYTVSFNSNGGTDVEDQLVKENGFVSRPANPQKSGYALSGWFKEEDCINEWFFGIDTITEDITLYAKWESADIYNE